MKTFYISLWDSMGSEATFPGYSRAAVPFHYQNGAFTSASPISWPVYGSSYQNLTSARIHESQYGPELFSFPLSNPIGSLCSGDTVNFSANGIKVSMDAGLSKVISREVSASVDTFESFMADHPDATPQQVWDAAFVAGHQTAHTLLTGEPL